MMQMAAFVGVLALSLTASAEQHPWYVGYEFPVEGIAIEGIPVKLLDPGWVAASPLQGLALPPQASEPGETLAEHDASFETTKDLDGDGRREKALVGVYRTKGGDTGTFLLVLRQSANGRWRKRALFQEPGKPGFTVLHAGREGLEWATCMECDTSCKVIPARGEWTLKCSSCCE